jgi:hypothetical protein
MTHTATQQWVMIPDAVVDPVTGKVTSDVPKEILNSPNYDGQLTVLLVTITNDPPAVTTTAAALAAVTTPAPVSSYICSLFKARYLIYLFLGIRDRRNVICDGTLFMMCNKDYSIYIYIYIYIYDVICDGTLFTMCNKDCSRYIFILVHARMYTQHSKRRHRQAQGKQI